MLRDNEELERLKHVLALPASELEAMGVNAETLARISDKLILIEKATVRLQEYKEQNRLEDFHPNPPQMDFLINYLNPVFRTFTYTGGNRRGKTTIVTIKTLAELFGYFPFVWESINNDGDVIMKWEDVYRKIKQWEGQTFRIIKDEEGRPLIHLIFNHNHPRNIKTIGQGWEDHIYEVIVPSLHSWWPASREKDVRKNILGIQVFWTDKKTGSTLRIMSNDQPEKKHEGGFYDSINYDEPCRREIYVANARGLVDRDGKECFAMTLLKHEAWIYRDVINRRNEDGTPDRQVYNNYGGMQDNVGFGITDSKFIDTFSKKLTKEERSARIDGRPSFMSGLVFGAFERNKHLIQRYKIPLDWIVDIAIDFHPRTEQAVLFLATSDSGMKYVVDEIWEHGNIEDIGNEIISRIKRRQYRIGNIIIDPSTKGQGINVSIEHSVYERWSDYFYKFGYQLDTGSKRREDGIILCKELLWTRNSQTGVLIFDDLRRFVWEIESWMYDEQTQRPIDKDDHMMENFGRLCLLDTKYTPEINGSEEFDSRINNNFNRLNDAYNSNDFTGY